MSILLCRFRLGGGTMERLVEELYTFKGKVEDCENDYFISVQEKLREYEYLEEQGLLLKLPCKVGDTLYYPSGYFNIVIPIRLNEIVMSFVGLDTCSFQYNCCSFDECGDVYEEYEFGLNDFNKAVFLTQAEAEKKLKEIGGENEID